MTQDIVNIIVETAKTINNTVSYEDIDIIRERTDNAKKIFEKESRQSKVDFIVESCIQ